MGVLNLCVESQDGDLSASTAENWHVIVDLRLLLPGGMNGGIKPGFFGLFSVLRELEDKCMRCTFLTNSWSHSDLVPIRRTGDIAICVKALEGRLPDVSDFMPGDFVKLDPPIGWIDRIGADLYYNPLCEEVPDTGTLPIVILHADVLHRDIPESLDPAEISRRDRFFEVNSVRAQRIQTISEFSRQRLETYYPAAVGKVFVTHLPVQDRLAISNRNVPSPVVGDYFLYPANFWPHKNHEFLLEAYASYLDLAGDTAWQLVLTGNDELHAQLFMERVKARGLSERIRFLGHLPQDQHAAVFARAGALVFPSRYEGFGIPPLEAMVSGVPVLCSDTGSIPEVAGDGALMLTGFNQDEWAEAMVRISTNPELRSQLIIRGRKHLESFSLVRAATRLGEELKSISRNRFAQNEASSHQPISDESLPLISVVVPSLNQVQFLARCLDSILTQNYPAVECLVQDGGSTDGTLELLRSYSSQVYWWSAPDGGQAAAINMGLAKSQGSIFCYLNSDDALPPGALSHVGRFFKNYPEVDLVYGRAQVIDDQDRYLADYPTDHWDWEKFQAACIICQPAAFMRRRLLDKVGSFNEAMTCSIDYEYWMRAFLLGAQIQHEPVMLGFTRDHRKTKTRQFRSTIYREIIDMQLRFLGKAHRQWWYEFICCLKWEVHSRVQWIFPSRLEHIRLVATWLHCWPIIARFLLWIGAFDE